MTDIKKPHIVYGVVLIDKASLLWI